MTLFQSPRHTVVHIDSAKVVHRYLKADVPRMMAGGEACSATLVSSAFSQARALALLGHSHAMLDMAIRYQPSSDEAAEWVAHVQWFVCVCCSIYASLVRHLRVPLQIQNFRALPNR